MNDPNGRIGRRDALTMTLGANAGLALRPGNLWPHGAGWDDFQATRLVTDSTSGSQ
ncbi:MAG TPA: hypothetical protein VF584_10120 [Longimicrobium sp.]